MAWGHVVTCVWEQRIAGAGAGHVQRALPDGCADVIVTAVGEGVIAGPATRRAAPRRGPARPADPGRGGPGRPGRPGRGAARRGRPARGRRPPGSREDLVAALGSRDPAALRAIDRWLGDIAIDPRVAAACAELRATPGRPIAAVAAAVGLSPRQLRRRMRTEAGLGPRTLGRIARLQRFLALAEAGGPEATLARLAVTCGDADQPHLTREVRRLAGLPPAELLRERSRTGA